MKTMKKIFAALSAGILSLSIAFAAACAPSTNSGDDKKDKDNSGSVTTEEKDLFSSLSKQTEKYASANVEFEVNFNETVTTYDKDAVKTDENVEVTQGKANADGQFNLAEGAGDVSIVTDGGEGADGLGYTYWFIRDWEVYYIYNQNKAITDFSDADIKSAMNLKDDLSHYPVLANYLESAGYGETLSNLIVPASGAAIISLANACDVLEIEGDTVTVDLNLLAYNFIQKVKSFADKVKLDTTFKEFLELEEVRYLIDDAAMGVDGKAIQAVLKTLLIEIEKAEIERGKTVEDFFAEKDIDLSDLAVEADEGSTAQDYILKIMASDTFNALAKLILDANHVDFSMENVLNISVRQILELVPVPEGEAWNEELWNSLKEWYIDFFDNTTETKTEFSFSFKNPDYPESLPGNGESYIAEDAKITYTLEDGEIKSEHVTAKLTRKETYTSTYNGGWRVYEESDTINITSATVNFADTVFTLEELNIEPEGGDKPGLEFGSNKPVNGEYRLAFVTVTADVQSDSVIDKMEETLEEAYKDIVFIVKDGSTIVMRVNTDNGSVDTEYEIKENGNEYCFDMNGQRYGLAFGYYMYMSFTIHDSTEIKVGLCLNKVK